MPLFDSSIQLGCNLELDVLSRRETVASTAASTMPLVKDLVFEPTTSAPQLKNLELLKSGLFADCEIVLGKKTWKVHKFIVCSRSKFFQQALTGNWPEARERRVKLNEEDFTVEEVDFILECMYAGDRKFTMKAQPGSERSGFEACARIYTQAEFLLIPEICVMAKDAVDVHRLLRRSSTKQHCFTSDWVQGMEMLYKKSADMEDHPMRQAMLMFCFMNYSDRRAVKTSADFTGLIKREPRFARDWVLTFMSSSVTLN